MVTTLLWLHGALLILLAATWFLVNRKLAHDAWSPLGILLFSWGIPLGLRTLGLSELEGPWDLRTLVVIGWVTLCLVGISAATSLVASRMDTSPGTPASLQTDLRALQHPAVLLALLALFGVTVAAYLYSEFVTNPVGIPLVSVLLGGEQLTGDLHRWGKDTKWSAITPFLFFLGPMWWLVFRVHPSRTVRWGALVLAFLYPVFGLLKLSRSDLFVATLSIVATDAYYRRYTAQFKRSGVGAFLRYGALFAGSLGLYYAVMAVRIGTSTVGTIYGELIGFRLRSDTPVVQLLAAVYGYAALPFENFQRFFSSSPGGWNPGVSSLRPFFALANQGDWADRIDATVAYPDPVSGAAGSASFLTTLYAEAGILGVVLVPVFYALLVCGIYLMMRRRPSLLTILLWVNFIYPWAWLYFNNAFSVLTIYLNAAAIVMLGLVLRVLGQSPAKAHPRRMALESGA